jgi:type II secretory pathway pseudopilin PulG
MKKNLHQRSKAAGDQSGFSLIEVVVAVVLLMAVLGVVVKGISSVQQRNFAETSNVDAVQDARDFIDQVVRDIHGVGFPPPRVTIQAANPYCTDSTFTGQVNAAVRMNPNVACGITTFSTTGVSYEADLDGTGTISVVFLNLVPGTNTATCPCILQRGVVTKAAWVNNPGIAPQYFTTVNGVLNSGNGAGAGTIPIALQSASNYQIYATADVFDAYDANANLITAACTMGTPGNPGTNPDCGQIRSLQVTVNVVPGFADPTTGQFQVFSVTSKARINF